MHSNIKLSSEIKIIDALNLSEEYSHKTWRSAIPNLITSFTP